MFSSGKVENGLKLLLRVLENVQVLCGQTSKYNLHNGSKGSFIHLGITQWLKG